MKNLNLLRYALSFILILFTLQSSAFGGHEPKNIKSLLWKIEGEGIETSYLYGTIHILKQEDFFLKESLRKAFPETEQLVLEVDINDSTLVTQYVQHAQMKGEVTIASLLDKKDYEKLDNYLKSTPEGGLENYQNWMPYMFVSALFSKVVGDSPASYEQTFVQMAMTQQMDVFGLETIEEQFSFFHQLPYERQARALSLCLNNEEAFKQEFEELVTLYKAEHVEGLQALTVRSLNLQGINPTVLLDQRNKKWIDGIKAYAQEKPTFFAVGAAHLGGEAGVIALLREAGLTVTPVE